MAGPIAYYEVRWRPADSDGEWTLQQLDPSASSITIKGVDKTKMYTIQARSVGPTQLKSVWVDISHTVAGNAPPPVPQNLVATSNVINGVDLNWDFLVQPPADIETVIERGAAVGGPFTVWAKTKATSFTVVEKAPGTWYYRVRTKNYNDVYSAYSSVVSGTPVIIAGAGVNLLPDNYSTLEAAALPSLQTGNFTVARVATAGNFKVVGAYQLTRTGAAAEGYLYFSPTGEINIPRTDGKKYILSFYYRTTVAGVHQAYAYTTTPATHVGTTWTAIGDNQWHRASCVVDPTSFTTDSFVIRIDFDATATGNVLMLDGIMVEEQLGDQSQPSAYSRGSTASIALAAFAAAAAAQDTADGKIDSWYQGTAPAHPPATLGDFWVNTSDGNKLHRSNGSSWVVIQDSAILTAITNAATAQGTADGKVRTWFLPLATPPTASAVGDLWYVTDQSVLKRWSGSGWVLVADNAAETLNDYIANGKFIQGTDYWTLQTGWRSEAGATAFGGSGTCVVADPGGPDSSLINNKEFSVEPGETYIVSAMVKQVGNTAGVFEMGLLLYTEAGTAASPAVTMKNGTYLGWDLVSGVYKKIAALVRITGTAKKAKMRFARYSQTAGYWAVDNVSVTKVPSDLDDVPDSVTYAKPRATTLVGGVPVGVTTGKNNVPNPRFSNNLSLRAVNTPFVAAQPFCDDWATSGVFTYAYSYHEVGSGVTNLLMRQNPSVIIPASLGYTATQVTSAKFNVQAGRVYDLYASWSMTRNATPPAGFDGLTRIMAAWYDGSNVALSQSYFDISNLTVGTFDNHLSVTAPTNASRCDLYVQYYVRNTTAGALNPAGALWCDMRIFHVGLFDTTDLDDEVTNGVNYGRTSNLDLYDSGGYRRIGLRIGGSGQRVGNQRNLNQVVAQQTATTTKLSATSAGAVSVLAHTLNYGSFSVAYSAVSNAITGLTQNVTYVIYTYDDDFSGGTRTYYAGANPAAVSALGDGVVIVGQIKIPTSGSSSGGGGGGGTDPNDWCVDASSFFPDGEIAQDLLPGMMLPCYNGDPDRPNIRHLMVQKNDFALMPCLRIITTSGMSLVASKTTPMTLRSGGMVWLPDMMNREALVYRLDGSFTWEKVVKIEDVGERLVAKIVVHQQCYFAGETMEGFIMSHNIIQYKP